MIDRTPEAIELALTDLLKSDGWDILTELVQQQYGAEAFERAVGAYVDGSTPADVVDTERAVIPQIRAAFKAARLVLDLPAAKLRVVKGAAKRADVKRKTPSARFQEMRRIPSA